MSDLNEELKALSSTFTLICNLSKEAADVIQEYLNEKSSCENTQKVIKEKISKTCDSLQQEIKKIDNTKSKLLNLSYKDDIQDSTEVSQPTVESESIETGNKKTEGSENDKKEENKENESELTEELTEKNKKPMLKIVDFSKLVDPRNLELMNKNHKRKERNMNSSVIVLSSSEDEKTDKKNSTNSTAKNNLKTKVDTVKIRSFPVSSIRNFLQNTSANSKVKARVIVSKKPAPVKKVARVTKVDRMDELCGKDVKFRSKCYVKLLRVPCESLKSYYCGSIVSEEENNAPIILDERTGEIIDNTVSEVDQACGNDISKDKDLSESIKAKGNSDNLSLSKKKLRSAEKQQNENTKTDDKSKMSDKNKDERRRSLRERAKSSAGMSPDDESVKEKQSQTSAKNSKSKSEENEDKLSNQQCRQRREGNDSEKNKSKKVSNPESENTNSCDDTVGNRKKTADVSSEQINSDKNSTLLNEQSERNENESTKNKSKEQQKSNKNDEKIGQHKDDETDILNDKEKQRKKQPSSPLTKGIQKKKHPVDSKKTCVDKSKNDSKKTSSSDKDEVNDSSDEEVISQKKTDNTEEKGSHKKFNTKKKDIEKISSGEKDQDESSEKTSDQLESEQQKSKNREKTNGENEKIDSNKEITLDGDDHQEREAENTNTAITSDKETIKSTEKDKDTNMPKKTEKNDKQKSKNKEKVLEYDISSCGEEENEVSINKTQLVESLQLEANISDDENAIDEGNKSNSKEVEDNENKSDEPKKSSKKKNLEKKSDKNSSDEEIESGEDENNEEKSRKNKKKNADKSKKGESSSESSGEDENNEGKSGKNKKKNADKSKKGESSSESDNEGKRKRLKTKSPDKKDVNSIHSSDSDESDFETFNRRKMKNNKGVAKQTKRRVRDSEDSGSDKKEKSDSELNDSNLKANSDSSDADSENDQPKKTNNRKRIRRKSDQSSSGSDDEVTTRKKIKKMISKDSLSDQTKQAAAEERERKQRIAEKQKKYNQIYEMSDIASSKVDKLVLDFDEETREPLLEVDKTLVAKLKPHQASGVQFMWDTCFESLKRTKSSSGSGCILAHCMGLGKTLQVITLVNTLLEASEKTKIKSVLIVTPLSTVLNWKAEFEYWLPENEEYEVYELASSKCQNSERAYCVQQWHQNGGILITSYALFRNLSNEKNKRVTKKLRQMFIEGFVDPGPDLVICDEGHLLKNEKTNLSVAMNKIKTRRRIVLTGTPLQNNLKEYYCMVQFVKPNLLGTYREYLNRFVNPITNGQYTDSTEYDINIMRRRSHVLHKLLDGIVQRRDYAVLSPYLPPKFEYVLFLTLSECQKKLYTHYMDHFARKTQDDSSNRTSYLFKDYQALCRICIHPRVLLDKSMDDQQKLSDSDEESIGSLKDFIADGTSDSDSSSSKSKSDSGSSGESTKKKKQKKRSKRVTRAQASNQQDSNDESEEDKEEVETEKEWWQQYCDGDELDNIAHSTKLLLLFEILKECEQIGDKVLVFSQSLYALNVIEYFLEKIDEATQNGTTNEKTLGYSGSWSPGLDYFRLDGSTNCSLRSNWCDSFNKESNTRARLFLLSTKAGGLGINLVGANRVIIFDVSWNPSYDTQSIYRVYRFGQLKPAYIYRFVMYGTMEMKIYERQVTKQAISKRVIDEQQIDRHYKQNDLTELYKFEVPDPKDRPIPLVPKDVLLGEMLRHHEGKIFKYHEHQSLLENKEDETLNEEERKAAWDEFENEKVERTKQTLIGNFSVNTIQVALRSIIKRDNPSWNNNQILSIIPQLIQQLNIQISQGDNTMYNRIATEVKIKQEEYARKMQMQMNQYRLQMAQRQQQMSAPYGMPNPFSVPNPYFSQFQNFMNNALQAPGPSSFNPSDVVELN